MNIAQFGYPAALVSATPFTSSPPRLRSGAGQHRNIVVIGGLKCPYFFLHSDCEFSSTHEKRNSAARKTKGSAICCRCAKAKMAVACAEKMQCC